MLRDQCLNEEAFDSLGHARRVLGHWRHDYNHVHPHSALDGIPPAAARRPSELFVGSTPPHARKLNEERLTWG